MNKKQKPQRVHFIAIGGAVMHNLAITLKKKGFKVTGSDDEIFEPSSSKLEKHNLLPATTGWHPDKITENIDYVILGMHARKDNPELIKALDLGIKIYSYPEYIYELTKGKKRIVISGSHGKTTITAMIIHILNYYNYRFDFLVGSQLKGFDTMVRLSDDSGLAILEGDEYLSSALDTKPKFLWYKPDICVISGIAWDHVNVFPSINDYMAAFKELVTTINKDGHIIYYKHDKPLQEIIKKRAPDILAVPYEVHEYTTKNYRTFLVYQGEEFPIKVFGNHNLQNFNAAKQVCELLGIESSGIYRAMASFEGASRRLQQIVSTEHSAVYIDFAHSPSKLKATINSVKEQYPGRLLVACMELHTYSSLNLNYISQYAGAMDEADTGLVYFDPEVFRHKKLKPFTSAEVKKAFNNDSLHIFTDKSELIHFLERLKWSGKNLLIMSSGNFSGININDLANKLINK